MSVQNGQDEKWQQWGTGEAIPAVQAAATISYVRDALLVLLPTSELADDDR